MTIKRVWHGWATKENADKYQNILNKQVLPSIEEKQIPGYKKIEVIRIELEDDVEFVTIMTFESLQNVIDFKVRITKEAMSQMWLKRYSKDGTKNQYIMNW